jgi:hypothetical protein
MKAPIALFCFNRPDLLSETLKALKKNTESSESELYIFSDGPRNDADIPLVQEVRELVNKTDGFYRVHRIMRETNIGLAENIINGINEVLSKNKKVIVLEDDIKVSDKFLSFMNEALQRYESFSNIWHISGWNYPINTENLSDMFLWRVMNCWGWATWADRWQHFSKEPEKMMENFTSEELYRFNLDGNYDFWKQVQDNYKGKINTWAVFWYATIFKNNGLCLNPTQTLVDNIGFGSGTNCIADKNHTDILHSKSLIDWQEEFNESQEHVNRIKKFLQSNNPSIPLDLTEYKLNQVEQSQLVELLTLQNFSLKSSLEQIWYLMDLVWDNYALNNYKPDSDQLQKYYSHPVWLLNGLYTEADPDSIRHRSMLSTWIKSKTSINTVVDIGGGIGFLARLISSDNPGVYIDVLEPFPSDYAKRMVQGYSGVKFISNLKKTYDCITLMDVLEHVEDPVEMVYSLIPYLSDQGYMITGNCFKPVIKCHLPCTFHLHYSFVEIVQTLGFDFVEKIPGTHIEIFKKVRSVNLSAARDREEVSKAIYRNIMSDTSALIKTNNRMQLNSSLSNLYNFLDSIIEKNEPYIIYGAGTGARVLVEALGDQIVFLIDKNAESWLKTRFGKQILSPEVLKATKEKILISVLGRENSVIDYLVNTLQISPDRIIEICV